jgi:hypothetical protein
MLTAESITTVLSEYYGRSTADILFAVADNTNLCPAIAIGSSVYRMCSTQIQFSCRTYFEFATTRQNSQKDENFDAKIEHGERNR